MNLSASLESIGSAKIVTEIVDGKRSIDPI
jgi:hypothetical protein